MQFQKTPVISEVHLWILWWYMDHFHNNWVSSYEAEA